MKTHFRKILLANAILLLAPALAQAHPWPGDGGGLQGGFNHPLHGWDHFLVMLAVGVWAAQQGGRAMWRLPLMFVAVMSLGGVLGAAGLRVPGVELLILLSVPVFGFLVVRRAHLKSSAGMALVGFFAFFHGLAHGIEMPVSASLISFALGFVMATLLLHAVGMIAARVIIAYASRLSPAAPADDRTHFQPVEAI